MLGNSFALTNDMPQMLAELTGAEVVHPSVLGSRIAVETIAAVIRLHKEECL